MLGYRARSFVSSNPLLATHIKADHFGNQVLTFFRENHSSIGVFIIVAETFVDSKEVGEFF